MFVHKSEKLLITAAIVCFIAGIAVVWACETKPNAVTLPSPIARNASTGLSQVKKYEPGKKGEKQKPHKEETEFIQGRLTDEKGEPMEGVVVSDGFSCVKTNRNGQYKLAHEKAARFVYYSVPDYCEVTTHSETDKTALFYQPVVSRRKTYDFILHRLPEGKEKSYRLIVFGDPQVTNAINPFYTGPMTTP